ncbi:DNA helicae [Bacillus phage vB_BthS_BMBphi]|nr:DNA helicae [Bacillus phage vB_BthS_BMBphi]
MSLFSGEMILSKILEDGSLQEAVKYGLEVEDFQLKPEKDAYNFILKYYNDFGKVCDWRTVMSAIPDFNFREDCQDSMEYLVKTAKQKRKSKELEAFMNRHIDEWGKPSKNAPFNVDTWMDKLTDEMEEIRQRTSQSVKVGTSIKDDFQEFLDELEKRESGESNQHWESSFDTINREIGGYYSGNCYTWFAESGRGKSVVTSVEGCHMAQFQGAKVLVWALEMKKYEWLARAYSFISANASLQKQNIGGVEYLAGFKSNDLIKGNMEDSQRGEFIEFIKNMGDYISGDIIVRGKSDRDFHSRTIKDLERDIINTGADIVIVDPFYLLDYERNSNNTTGGAATATSQALNRIAGSTNTVIFAITQSDSQKTSRDEERELAVPTRSEVKKTSALLEDAFNLFAFDSCDGRFQLSILKGRQGGEGTTFEGTYLPSIGYVKEPQKEEIVKQFGAKAKKFEF